MAAIDNLNQELREVEVKIAEFHASEEKKKQRVFALQDDMQRVQVIVNNLREEKNTAQVELAKLQTKLEDIEAELYNELHVSRMSLVERGVSVLAMDQVESVVQDIQKYKYKLSLIGGIDENVMTEFNATKERYESILSQITDLESALRDVTTLADELEVMMKKKRERAFRTIKKEFSRYFELLFEGGKADLIEVWGEHNEEVEDSNDGTVLAGDAVAEEAETDVQEKQSKTQRYLQGIDVLACPPGKKIQNLQALSGGERTLTSIALICAILHTNPSPFVLLDEVEAALDEANTIRFTSILRELAAASQFILISHNRATMHAADALYGVTMGADGVSQLVSVSLPAESAS
jgi:chromosome segregation protein